MKKLGLVIATFVVAGLMPAAAKVPWVKKAQKAGFAQVQNCQACHASATPNAKGEPFGEMGKWMVEKKKAMKAKECDLAWLKDYYARKKK